MTITNILLMIASWIMAIFIANLISSFFINQKLKKEYEERFHVMQKQYEERYIEEIDNYRREIEIHEGYKKAYNESFLKCFYEIEILKKNFKKEN